MRRGTTPTLKFSLPFDSSEIDVLNIAFTQDEILILEKRKSDCELDGSTVIVHLTETDTLLFTKGKVEMQIRCACGGKKLASNVMSTTVDRILKDGVLDEV